MGQHWLRALIAEERTHYSGSPMTLARGLTGTGAQGDCSVSKSTNLSVSSRRSRAARHTDASLRPVTHLPDWVEGKPGRLS